MENLYPSSAARIPAKQSKQIVGQASMCFATVLLAIIFMITATPGKLFAQAPAISYSSPQTYTINSAISALTPTSSGGAVAALAYGGTLTSIGQGFTGQTAIAVDAAGNVYETFSNHNAVKKFPVGGGASSLIGTGFFSPQGVAVDAAGNVYVADTFNGAVKKIAAAGGATTTIASGISSPTGIAVDAAGNIYFTDYTLGTVNEIPAGGTVPVTLGSGFSSPTGVAIDGSGNLYVADQGNNAVKMVPAGGGSPVAIGSGFDQPQGVAVDGAGNVYVADLDNNAVKMIPVGGGAPIVLTTGITSPSDIAIGVTDNLYISNQTAAPAQEIKPVGGYFINPGLPVGLSFNSSTGVISGTPIAASPATNYTVTAFNSSGSSQATVNIKVLTNNTNLSNLVLSSGTLTPAFATGTKSYTATASNTAASITITPTTGDGSAIIKINGTTVASGSASPPIPLSFGVTNFTIVITDGTIIDTYTITVTRPALKIATLSSLTISTGSLSPAFAAGTTAYSDLVSSATTSVTVTPTVTNATATVTVNGTTLASGSASAAIPLTVGDNAITTVVTAQDGVTTDTYTINVTRPPSGLSLSYASPQTFTAAQAVTLAPTSSGVAAYGYSSSAVTFASGFSGPGGIGTDAAGNIYVADQGNKLVKKIPAGGGTPIAVGSGFTNPTAVAVDPAGNIWVIDSGDLKEVPANGGAITTKPFGDADGVAVDSKGNVYVLETDGGFGTITEFLVGGGIGFATNDNNNYDTGIAVDRLGNIFVSFQAPIADIPEIDEYGTAGSYNNLGGGLIFPTGVAVDGIGNVFVADDQFGSIIEYPVNGAAAQFTIGSGLSLPNGIALDGGGNIYESDGNTNTVKEIKAVGGYFISPGLPAGLNFDETTGIISGTPTGASPATNYTITAHNSSGSTFATLNIKVVLPAVPVISYSSPQTYTVGIAISPLTPTSSGGAVATPAYNAPIVEGSYTTAQGVAVDAAGNIYVANTDQTTVSKLPAGGGAAVTIGSGFNGLQGIAVDAAGNLYVADSRKVSVSGSVGAVYKIAAGTSTKVSIGSGFKTPEGVAVDAAGNVYVADMGNNTVTEIPTGGGAQVTLGSGFNAPRGVAVDAAGNVYIADTGNNKIKELPANGGAIVTSGFGFNGPQGIAVDPAGDLFVGEPGSNAVREISAGNYTTVTLKIPASGVAVDGAGNVYAAAGSVYKITPAGGYYISALPAGLSFNQTTGAISGTPTVVSPATNYTVTAYNLGGSGSTTVNIKVINNPITLANLVLSSGTLTPSFDSGTTKYSASVPATITSITITPTTRLGASTVTVNGTAVASGSASASIPLANGTNTIATVVTGADGVSTNTYTVTVTRVPSPDATLSALSLSLGTLSPAFSPTVTSYTDIVLATDPSITVTPTTDYPLAVVTVNGTAVASGTASSPITLNTGDNTVTIVVTAEDGATKQTYTVNVNRPILDITALSYATPQNYMVSVPITPLVPTSAHVSAEGYSDFAGGPINTLNGNTGYGNFIGLDAVGNAYISTGTIVQKCVANASPVTVATGLGLPEGIVVDAAGDLYVADAGNNDVVEFETGGGKVTFTGFSGPQGLAIDGAGNIYVADRGNNAIKEIPAGGGTITTVVSGLTSPSGVAIDGSGNIYVADNSNGIKEFLGGGGTPVMFLTGFGSFPTVAVDAAGNIFTSDGSDVIELVAANGSIDFVLNPGDIIFNFSGLGVDPSGSVYAFWQNYEGLEPQQYLWNTQPVGGYHLDKFLPKGLSLNGSTGVISGTPGAASPATDYQAAAMGNTGNAYAVVNITVAPYAAPAFSYSSPQTYAQGTAIVPLIPTSLGVAPLAYSSSATVVASGFNEPQGVAADAAGNVYVADGGHGLVKKIPPGGSPASIGTGFSKPTSVAVDAAGNVYVADFTNNAVYEIASGGSTTSIASGFNHPTGVAVDAAGNVYVADNGNNAVKEIPSGGGSPVTFASTPNPYGVAVDGAGNVYVGNGGVATITMIPAGGGTPVNVGSGFINPFGVAADVMGNVFVVDSGHALVKEIPVGGGAPVTIGPGGGDELFGIAVNGAGNVYVTDQTANTVKEISPIGGYYIGTALPAGLSFNQTTGTISGTPTALSPATNYTVTAYNVAGSGTATVNIKVILNPITLANLILSSGTLTPTFASGTNTYTASVINAVSSITVTPTTTDPAASVTVNGTTVTSGSASASIPLSVGTNTITTVVTGSDGVSTNTYTVTVTRPPSADARLAGLALSSGTLTPSFLTVTTNYTASVSSSTASITVTPTTNDATATVTVNGTVVASGSPSASIPLAIGDNTITTVITAQDGTTTETYTVVVTRPSTDATLAGLAISAGFLNPAFATGTTSYTTSVLNGTSSITLTPTTNNANATVTVNGVPVTSGSASSGIPLAYGPNVITTVVTAQDGITTDTYTVTITRVKPTYNPDLASITTNPKESTLVSVTGPGNLNYTEAVTNSTTSIQVIPTAQDPNATITVNGVAVISGAASASIPLAIGPNTITTVITSALGGLTRTIILTVDRAGPSSNAEIASITTNPKEATLVEVTGTGYLNYSEAVTNSTTSIEVIATAKDPNATMTVNGITTASGTASAPIVLAVGPNLITTVVTAQDGVTTKTVTLTVNRAGPSNNAGIVSISTNPFNRLIDATGPGYLNYTESFGNSVSSIEVTVTAMSAFATITVNGAAVTSGSPSSPIALAVGPNTINTIVTAQDGITTKSIIITVYRAAPGPDNGTYQQISVTKPAADVTIEGDGVNVHEGVSPNGDGINDYLAIDGIINYPDNRLMIVDRNGVMVYQTKGYDNSSKLFDGHSSINGAMQLPGTYFYTLDYSVNGQNKHKTGFIILKY